VYYYQTNQLAMVNELYSTFRTSGFWSQALSVINDRNPIIGDFKHPTSVNNAIE